MTAVNGGTAVNDGAAVNKGGDVTVLRKLAMLALGSFGAAGAAFLGNVVLARYLGPASFGDFAFAFTLATVTGALAGFGLGSWWLQVYGRHGAAAVRWLRASLPLLLFGVLLAAGLHLVLAGLQEGDRQTLAVLFLAVMLAQVASALALVRFQLEERPWLIAAWQGVPALVRLLVTLACVAAGLDLLGIGVAHAALYAVTLLSSAWLVARMARGDLALHGHAGVTPQPLPEQIDLRRVWRGAWPFAASGFAYFVYHRGDVVVLGLLAQGEAVGIYAAAVTLLLALYLVPSVLQRFLLARLFRWGAHDTARLRIAYNHGCGNLLLLALLLALAVGAAAGWLMPLLFGAHYAASADALRLLLLAVPARYVGTMVGGVLVDDAANRAKTAAQAQAALVMVAGGLLLVPSLSWTGSALAVIVAEYFLLWRYLAAVDRWVFPGAGLRGWRLGLPEGWQHD